MHRPEFEPVPEIFDIHVMAFADESATTVDALARIFGIDRNVAQRLISEAPVVVKRAASPEVANSLLDALGELGAQVVLLPSQGEAARAPVSQRIDAPPPQPPPPSPPPIAELESDDERDFFAAGPLRSDPAPAPRAAGAASAGWGGLDLGDGDGRAQLAPRAVLEEDPFAVPEPRAQARPPARSAPYASFAPPSSTAYVAPQARIEEEPSDELDEELSPGEWNDDAEEPALEDDEPPPADTGGSLELAVPLPTRRGQPLEPPAPPRRSAASSPGVAPSRRGAPAQAPDLGLGLVPPLPALGSLPPLPPPARPPRAGSAVGPKIEPRATGMRPPMAPLLPETPRAAGRAAAQAAAPSASSGSSRTGNSRVNSGPVAKQAAWLSRSDVPSGPDLPRMAAVSSAQPAVAPAPAPASGGMGSLADERARTATAAALTPVELPVRRGSRLVGLLQIVAGVAVFAAGLQLEHTVLHGSADTLWLVLHAFGLYGIGHGVYSMRP